MSADTQSWQEFHACAIKYHNEAFQLEAEKSEQAPLRWQQALEYWGELFRMQEFWEAVKSKGRLLEPSLFEDDQHSDELKIVFPRFLLEIHTSFILEIIDIDSKRAAYHFALIRNSDLGASEAESRHLREHARQQIYQQRFRDDLLEQNEDDKFNEAIRLAEIVHLLDPTEETSRFLLKTYLAWVQKYENEQLHLITEINPDYFENISKKKNDDDENEFECVDPDFDDELYNDIMDDDEIRELQEEQATLMDELEAALNEALSHGDTTKLSLCKMISAAQYFVGRHYCTTHEERNLNDAAAYLEDAVAFDSTNESAAKLLRQVDEFDEWE